MSCPVWRVLVLAALLPAVASAQFALPGAKPRLDRYGDPLPEGALARLGSVRLRHGFITYALAFSPDGKVLASGGGGRGLVLWDVATGKARHALAGTGHIYALAFSPDGQRVAGAYEVNRVRLWDVASGREVGSFTGGAGGVPQAIAFSPDGKMLACAGYDGKVHLFDLAAQKEITPLQGHTKGVKALAFSPDSKTLASGGLDNTVRLWDVGNGKERTCLKGHKGYVLQVAFTPDGQTLLTGGEKEGVRFWNVSTGREERFLEAADCSGKLFTLTPDGRTVATGHADGSVRLWDTATGREQRRWAAHPQVVHALALSPDGKLLATGAFDSAVRLWDTRTGGERHRSGGTTSYVSHLAFADGGRSLRVGGRDRVLRRWDWASDAETIETTWPVALEWQSLVSPDGRWRASMKYQADEVLLWERGVAEPRRLGGHKEGATSLAFSPDSRQLATGDGSGTVRFWDCPTGREVNRLETRRTVGALAFSSDGARLATGATAIFGRAPGGEDAIGVWDRKTGARLHTFGLNEEFYSLAFSPDGRWLATAVSFREGGVAIWDLRSGKLHPFPATKPRCECVAFSPDGRWLAWGTGDRESVLRIGELATGREVWQRRGHHTGVTQATFSPDGRLVASAGGDATVLVWGLSGAYREGKRTPVTRPTAELDALWTDLASADAARAFRAVQALGATAPDQAVPFLRERLRPPPAPAEGQVAGWLRDLGSDDFETREKAMRELAVPGAAVAKALRQARQTATDGEVRRRLDTLLGEFEVGRSPDLLRVLRSLSVLEMLATSEARSLAEQLARQYEGVDWLAEEARASARRLARSGP